MTQLVPIIEKHLKGSFVLSSQNKSLMNAIYKAQEAGLLVHIASNLYCLSSAMPNEDRALFCQRHIFTICDHLFPGARLSHRTALSYEMFENTIVLSYKYKRIYRDIPGVTVYLLTDADTLESDPPFHQNLRVSSLERAWLENIGTNRKRGFPYRAGRELVEKSIIKNVRLASRTKAEHLLTMVKKIGSQIGKEEEAKEIEAIIKTVAGLELESTEPKAQSSELKAILANDPYDARVIERLEILTLYLLRNVLHPHALVEIVGRAALSNAAFIDSYFSNYIEGTKFEVDEAKRIVFDGVIPKRRPESHDMIGVYRKSYENLRIREAPPSSFESFYHYIKDLHSQVMKAHPSTKPGTIRDQENYVGTPKFVSPIMVPGTIKKALELLSSLTDGFARGLFLGAMLTEVHPFLDGNGRISRLVMNQELVAGGYMFAIIPTVYRIDYLSGVKRLTKENDPSVYVKMLLRAQKFTSLIPYDDFESMLTFLKQKRCFSDDPDDVLRF